MMTRRLSMILTLCIVCLLGSSRAWALDGTLYRLGLGSNRQEGCLPPCLCPITQIDDFVGTFELVLSAQDRCTSYYKVKRVNWVYFNGVEDVRVTGEGEYWVGGCLVTQQRLQLDLVEDNGRVRHFDSGVVTGGATREFRISIAANGFYCYDTVYNLVASPVRDAVPYTIHHTEYLEGCFDPCDCALRAWTARGSFLLVDLNTNVDPARKRYAVIDFTAETDGPIDPPDRSYFGQGIYSVGRRDERLVLDLYDARVGYATFDSGHVGYMGPWPEINIDISTNGFVCYNMAFYLHAVPTN